MLAYNKHAAMINNENSTNQGGKKASKATLLTKRASRPLANITNITTRERNTNKGKKNNAKPTLVSQPNPSRPHVFKRKKIGGKKKESSPPPTSPPAQMEVESETKPSGPRVQTRSKTHEKMELERQEHLDAISAIDPMLVDETQEWEDIDITDRDDPLSVAEYVNDVYEFYGEKEVKDHVNYRYMAQQTDITDRMRAILVDWMIAVTTKFRLLPETLFLSVNIIDRFLEKETVSRGQLQLVSVSAMLIASKYEEIYPPELNDFVYITDNSYTREDILDMESLILRVLDWNITVATPLHFLRRFSKAARSDWKTHNLSKYLIEVPLLDIKMLKYLPSEIAAAAVFIGRTMLHYNPVWTPTLEHYTGYSEAAVRACACDLNELVKKLPRSNYKAIRRKYASTKFGEVSKIPCVNI